MIRAILDALFTKELLDAHPKEWGVANYCDNPSSLGYSTTITPDTIQTAVDREVDVIVTHHDAWDFMFEQKEEVHALLQDKSLTHIWAHLPLDLADFGTSATLLSKMGCSPVATMTKVEGRIGELPESTCLATVRENLNSFLMEEPRCEHDANRDIQRVASVPGAGIYTGYLQEALAYGVDLYITGETNLSLLEYAKFKNVNVLVYSHNYSELPGVRAFARKIAELSGLELGDHLGDAHF